ncbi:MAG: Putative branched-chain-amino-acid aminotransferase [Nitrospira sp.]|nr:MAG: Putative branched-chain-amino-acid aminotransferase [Nitrospira sp.]
MWIFLNDRFVTEQDATISVFDHGFLYGDGVYETIRSYGTRIFMRDHHLSRLQRSADAIGLTIPIPQNEWPRLLHEAMDRNQLGNGSTDAYLRITVSRGEGEIGLDPALCPTPTVVIMAKPLHPPAAELYRHGVSLIVAHTRRNLPSALSPHIKSTNFLNNILAKREAIAARVFDALLLNWEGHLTECTVSNLFFVSQGQLFTPSIECGLLDGITRAILLQMAEELNIPVHEGQFTSKQLLQADECFLTNTSMEVMPVASINKQPIGQGVPGFLTRQLHRHFIDNRSRFLEPLD